MFTDIPGVEVLVRTTVVITSSVQSFYWAGYGFKLYAPLGSLPDGVDRCVVHISVSLAGQYQLPEDQELVSPVFWVHCDPPCQFKHKLVFEIQHCAKTTTKLTFVKAEKSIPHTFKKLESSGSFSAQVTCGLLELDDFGGIGVTASVGVEKKYCSNVFTLGNKIRSKELHFVVMKNLDAYLSVSWKK